MPNALHIALISYEYPPDTAVGRGGTKREDSVLVHRLQDSEGDSDGTHDLSKRIAPLFATRHRAAAFDVLEGPEYRAEAQGAVRLVPEIPLVVNLHTPSYLLRSMNTALYSPVRQAGSVEFLDLITPAEIPALLAETDLCVFPSLWETFPAPV